MEVGEQRDGVISFLKKYTAVDNGFVEDFFGLYAAGNSDNATSFLVDLDVVSKWIGVAKFNLHKTLRASYTLDLDYVVRKPATPSAGRGGATRRDILLTPDCFKTLCMMSRSAKAKEVRAYFVAVEKALVMYRSEIQSVLETRVRQLTANQRPRHHVRGGLVYVIKAGDGHSLYKLGRTNDLVTRLRSHGSALADDIDVVYVLKTDCMHEVETCVKGMLKRYQYRKYKEVYETDVSMIKEVMTGCQRVCSKVQQPVGKRIAQTGGSWFIVMDAK